ncbi:Cyclophilin-type peptidyl-prolyl cis-trans isomerase domain [Trypanosoma melophagium]|uniref:Cyclophilin-type peptidyl-prolyl cis-trans isomerase domain n=1 Tax=Trypanosoma melophagium TaxID=715481 RepID=UPI00351A8E9C|nr:Cyclophilin-type peptidyl-prolyl cis-trans isomerase domain [Trypanosoma melophagium]
MKLTAGTRPGCTLTPGASASGTHYASHMQRREHTSCWMELACFNSFPSVPSLSGSMLQNQGDLLASTRGAGDPACVIRVEFELFDDEAPKTCANFRNLCAGSSTSRQGQTYLYQGLTPCYRGTYFHKIIPQFCAQGGDLTMRVDKGANHFSSFGRGWFADENKRRRVNEVGLLLMANNGPNSNGFQFFITTSATEEKALNGRHVCFGRVVRGLEEFMREVGPYGDANGYPSRFVVVVECGVGPLPDTLPTMESWEETRKEKEIKGEEANEKEEVKGVVSKALEAAAKETAEAAATTSTLSTTDKEAQMKQMSLRSDKRDLHVSFKEGH